MTELRLVFLCYLSRQQSLNGPLDEAPMPVDDVAWPGLKAGWAGEDSDQCLHTGVSHHPRLGGNPLTLKKCFLWK